MTIRPKELKQQYDTIVTSVVKELLEHPDLASEEIASKLGISRDELLECYDIIRNDEELQDLIIKGSISPRFTMETSDLITKYEGYLTSILSGEEVYPLILEFHPGPICNSQCKFCFSDNWEYGEYHQAKKPVCAERIGEIFNECKQNGVEEIWFSGGKEPLVNPLTPQYIRKANEIGLRTRLYTNGIAMTEQTHESILGCYQVRISVNGANPVTYGRVQFPKLSESQQKNVFDRVLNNIAGLVKLKKERGANTNIGISQILQPDNHHEMIEFVEIGHRLGVDSIHFRLEAMGMVRDFTDNEKDTIRNSVSILQKNGTGVKLDIRGVAEGEFESRQTQFLPRLRPATHCRAGMLKRGLNPYGALYYCEFSSHPRFQLDSKHLRLGDVKKENLGEILHRNLGKYPIPCVLCQAHEYGLNITLERLERDLRYGIPIKRQPYYRQDNSI